MSGLIGKKIGMTSVFNEEGKNIPCTVIEAGPCVVTQVLTVDVFEDNDWVDVTGISKGKGFQGVVKRHGFAGVGGQTHGQHNRQRKPGSLGASSYPSRVFKGKRLPGQTGGDQVKVLNLRILKKLPENNLLLVKGSIPGAKGSYLLIYLDVKQYLANKRQGTHKSKQRNEVMGSTRKLKKQKGTGGARSGSILSPLFPGGGRVFGPVPRDYSFKLNKKLKQLARKSALTYKAKDNAITVVEDFAMEAPKTKEFIAITKNLKLDGKKILVVLPETNPVVSLSARNLQNVKVIPASNLNTYDVMNAAGIVLAETSVEAVNQMFGL